MTDPHPGSTRDPVLEIRLAELFKATQVQVVSNENGMAIRLHGGVQICLHRHLPDVTSGTWRFPLPFRTPPKVVGSKEVGFGKPTEDVVTITKTSTSVDVDLIAIGEWRSDGLA